MASKAQKQAFGAWVLSPLLGIGAFLYQTVGKNPSASIVLLLLGIMAACIAIGFYKYGYFDRSGSTFAKVCRGVTVFVLSLLFPGIVASQLDWERIRGNRTDPLATIAAQIDDLNQYLRSRDTKVFSPNQRSPKSTDKTSASATPPRIRIDFKESELFTIARRARIESEVGKMNSFLVGFFREVMVGIPGELPPFAIGSITKQKQLQDVEPYSASGMRCNPEEKPIYEEIKISDEDADNARAIRELYAVYVMCKILELPLSADPVQVSTRNHMRGGLVDYLLWSYDGHSAKENSICDVHAYLRATNLWKIREKISSNFGDKLVAHFVRAVLDEPAKDGGEDILVYVVDRLAIADDQFDNDQLHLAEVKRLYGDCSGQPMQ